MMDPTINRPAQIHSAVSLKERGMRIKSLHLAHVTTALERGIAIGAELEAAWEQCQAEGRGWLDWLKEIRYPARTASQNRRLNRNKDKLGALSATIADLGVVQALEFLAGPDEPEPEPKQAVLFTEQILCRAHRTGQKEPDPFCPQCLELRAEKGNPFKTSHGVQLPQAQSNLSAPACVGSAPPGPTSKKAKDPVCSWPDLAKRFKRFESGLIVWGFLNRAEPLPELQRGKALVREGFGLIAQVQRKLDDEGKGYDR